MYIALSGVNCGDHRLINLRPNYLNNCYRSRIKNDYHIVVPTNSALKIRIYIRNNKLFT